MRLTGTTLEKWAVIYIFLIAFLLRLAFVPNRGFEADIAFWKSWGLATRDHGAVTGLRLTNNNYPTPFSYTLGVMATVYSLVADPHVFQEYWQSANLKFLTVSKFFPILADMAIAILILHIGKHAQNLNFPTAGQSSTTASSQQQIVYLVLASLYLLNPVSIMDGAWWGQVDSLGVLLFLGAVICVFRRQPFLAGFIYITAMMTKLQNLIYGPVFFLFIWQYLGYTGLIRAIGGALVGFVGLNSQFFLAKESGRVLSSLTENYDYFPWMSLNAYNLWWIVARGAGMQMTDKISVIGITNAKSVGLILFSSLYLLSLLHSLWPTLRSIFTKSPLTKSHNHPSRYLRLPNHDATLSKRFDVSIYRNIETAPPAYYFNQIYRFFQSLILIAGAFFLVQTESHDRYAFPIFIFLLLLAPFILYFESPQKTLPLVRSPGFKLFFCFYILLSFLYFYNLHTALIANYPANGLPLLSSLTQPALTVSVSFIFLFIFAAYIIWINRKNHWLIWTLPMLMAIFLLLNKQLPLIQKKPVPLSSLTPVVTTQGYGQRMRNMPVNASFGPKSWAWLSDQYAFYRRGIGTHATSRHVYDVNRQFHKFSTDFGIDTEAAPAASAIFEIWGDGQLLFRSGKMGRFDLPGHAEVKISGVKLIELVTTDAGDGIKDDHTDWLNPMLLP